MSVPNQYFGSSSHESAVLKRDLARVRAARPDLFKQRDVVETRIDSEGKAVTLARREVRAVAPTPAQRHRLAWSKEWH